MSFTEKELKTWHVRSNMPEKEFREHESVGCFYCLNQFDTDHVMEWVNVGATPLCPICGIDSLMVLDDIDASRRDQVLADMRGHWFG